MIATSRAVLTLALGQSEYIQMAANLARSFKLWHKDSNIHFVLATDRPEAVPADLHDLDILTLKSNQYGKGFSPKLYIDQITPFDCTLFIDADCLIAGCLEPVFDRFDGHAVSAVGTYIEQGHWFGDVASLCNRFNLNALPLFVGGIYYLNKKEPVCQRVFETARELKSCYDEIGLVRLRGVPNEEPLMSLAMALHGQHPLPDDGTIKADAMNFPSSIEIDVFEGSVSFRNQTGQFRATSCLLEEAHPVIAHFNDSFAERSPYTHEAARLRKVYAEGWPLWAAGMYAKARYTLPQRVIRTMKDVFRPLYRRLFGTRPIKQNSRIPS